MLTSLEIENFKGSAARQRVDFAPLTPLFGANSAGKSPLLRALVHLHELLERGSADVGPTELGAPCASSAALRGGSISATSTPRVVPLATSSP